MSTESIHQSWKNSMKYGTTWVFNCAVVFYSLDRCNVKNLKLSGVNRCGIRIIFISLIGQYFS